MNVKLLIRVRDHILEEPRRLAMGNLIMRKDTNSRKVYDNSTNCSPFEFAPCNTAACYAGWTLILSKEKVLDWPNAKEKAIQLLDITLQQASDLFFVENWPKFFQSRYVDEEDIAIRAKVAGERIDYFIKYGN